MAEILVLVEHAGDAVKKVSFELLTLARKFGEPAAVWTGPGAEDGRERLAKFGAVGAMENSVRIPLGQLQDQTAELDRNKLLVVHCKGGYRSSIATSILRRAGFRDIANLTGGFEAWKAIRPTV